MTRSKRFYAAIIASLMALVLVAGAVTGIGVLSAGAAETPVVEPGWYVMGNGAGTEEGVGLKNCSWTEFKSAYKLTGTPLSGDEEHENYLGTWETAKLALYEGDQFKFLYADGTLAGPNDDSWGVGFVGGFFEIPESLRDNFWDGGLGNIQIKEGYQGWYTFRVSAVMVQENVQITVSYIYDNITPLPELETTYEMYVVGTIESFPEVGWPGQEGKTMLRMTPYEVQVKDENGEMITVTKYYSESIYFRTTDEIKVYNAVDGAYYPSGVDNNKSPVEDGWYVIEWQETAPDFEFNEVAAPETGANN